jgi:hypothetical protein
MPVLSFLQSPLSAGLSCSRTIPFSLSQMPMARRQIVLPSGVTSLRHSQKCLNSQGVQGKLPLLTLRTQACSSCTLSTLRRKTVRGVVTEGANWLFLVLTLQEDGTATCVESGAIATWRWETTRPSPEGIALVSAILRHWVRSVLVSLEVLNPLILLQILHSHEPFDSETDFFSIQDEGY